LGVGPDIRPERSQQRIGEHSKRGRERHWFKHAQDGKEQDRAKPNDNGIPPLYFHQEPSARPPKLYPASPCGLDSAGTSREFEDQR